MFESQWVCSNTPLHCPCVMKACEGVQVWLHLFLSWALDGGKVVKFTALRAPVATVQASWNVMAHAQKPDFVLRRNGRVHLNWRGASVQSTTGSRGVRISGSNAGYNMFRGSVKGTGQFPLHFPSRASPCAIAFQLESTAGRVHLRASLAAVEKRECCSCRELNSDH